MIGSERSGHNGGGRVPGAQAGIGGVLRCDMAERADDFVCLQLRGELTGRSRTASLRDALERYLVDDGIKRVRLDLSRLEFMDNQGVATLLALREESQGRGKPMLVERPGGQVREKLKVTGVLEVLQSGD